MYNILALKQKCLDWQSNSSTETELGLWYQNLMSYDESRLEKNLKRVHRLHLLNVVQACLILCVLLDWRSCDSAATNLLIRRILSSTCEEDFCSLDLIWATSCFEAFRTRKALTNDCNNQLHWMSMKIVHHLRYNCLCYEMKDLLHNEIMFDTFRIWMDAWNETECWFS